MNRYVKVLIAALVSLSLALTIVLLVFYLYMPANEDIYKRLSDAFTIATACLAGPALLALLTHAGTFDMLNYGVGTFFKGFTRQGPAKPHRDFYEYKTQKENQRKGHAVISLLLPALIIGALLVILALIFALV